MFPRSPVDRDVAFDSPFPVVLANLPGIVGCICGDDPRTIWYFGNLKCFEGWFIEPGFMDIRSTSALKLVPSYLFYSPHSRLIPFFCRDVLRIRRTVREINFPDLIPRSEQVEEDRLTHSLLAEFKVVPSIWYHSLLERRASCNRYSGRTGCR